MDAQGFDRELERARERSAGSKVGEAAVSAVTQSTLVVLLLNVVFAYLVFGVLFFGLVTAKL